MASGNLTVHVEPRVEWVHMCPPGDSNTMPCCGYAPLEMPLWHRMTLNPLLVTCPGREHFERRFDEGDEP